MIDPVVVVYLVVSVWWFAIGVWLMLEGYDGAGTLAMVTCFYWFIILPFAVIAGAVWIVHVAYRSYSADETPLERYERLVEEGRSDAKRDHERRKQANAIPRERPVGERFTVPHPYHGRPITLTVVDAGPCGMACKSCEWMDCDEYDKCDVHPRDICGPCHNRDDGCDVYFLS